ncbi:glycosyltransferase [Microbacterium sp. ZW T5_45]|uniref:glycosyltransferase n=1 Tax=Microbacterium sp. ZW T5_45 TaxID=3378080 RepID=UPI003854D32D
MRILHVTEAMATGVLDVIARMSSHQAQLGHHVEVAYSPHPDGPACTAVAHRLSGASRVHVRGARENPRIRRVLALGSLYRSLVHTQEWDIIHLHSTFAGLVGRVGGRRAPIVYSPHGYSFLRKDVAPASAAVFRTMERLLGPQHDLTLCVSVDEERTTRELVGVRALTVRNVLSRSEIDLAGTRSARRRPKVVNIGRWGPQKAPERFARAARLLHDVADFRWIGPGQIDGASRWTTSGWIDSDAVWSELEDASVIYFTSRWEGMPVGLMQAQAAGVPAVAMDCIGVRDVVIDGVTGHVASDEDQAIAILRRLLRNPSELKVLEENSRALRYRFADDTYGEDVIRAYETALDSHVN